MENEKKRISAGQVTSNSIRADLITTGTIGAKPVRKEDGPNRIAMAVIAFLFFAIATGALTWVAVKIWLEVLSII